MRSPPIAELQLLLNQAHLGDGTAWEKLLLGTQTRLHRFTRNMLLHSFASLKPTPEVDSVFNESWAVMLRAVQQTQPPTVPDFLRLATHKIRQTILNRIKRDRRWSRQHRESDLENGKDVAALDQGDTTFDPAQLALWTELHEELNSLPPLEQAVFKQRYFEERTVQEVAEQLQMPERQVRLLWMAARQKLADRLCADGELFS